MDSGSFKHCWDRWHRAGRDIISGHLLLFTIWITCGSGSAADTDKIQFSRDIRPILSDNCFACHGPDPESRKAKLRLDLKDEAMKPRGDEFVIKPGKPAESLLIERIVTKEEQDIMPPLSTGKKLTPAQKDLLTRWIADGAPWEEHWAFRAPKTPAVPAVAGAGWRRNEIDPFVLTRLEQEGLKPATEADKAVLARRAALDITGLPPTPAELDAYLLDNRPDAYERYVDRLLGSPRYGEHMARYWLDAARYADSHGYHIDAERSLWKYRDWVIDAFNHNVSFDQFTVEQLAGDLLTNATVEQKIASGFIRNNMSTGEGGAIEQEYQAKYTFDRVETASTIWMGLTMTCARCHTHKYDPITHREYFGLYALFNSIDEAVMDSNVPAPNPSIKVPSPVQAIRMEALQKQVASGRERLAASWPDLDPARTNWIAEWRHKLGAGWTTLKPEAARSTLTNGARLKVTDDLAIVAEGENPPSDSFELTIPVQPGPIAALRLETVPDPSLPGGSASRAEDGGFRLSEFEAAVIKKAGQTETPVPVKFSMVLADSAMAEREAAKAIDGKAETGWQPDTARNREPHSALFLAKEPILVPADGRLRVMLRFQASQSKRALGKFRIAAAQNAELASLLIPPKPPEWKLIGPFKTEGLDHGFTNVYPPETGIDFKKAYEGVREEIRWNARPDLADGKNHLLVNELHGVHGAYYLHRVIQATEASEIEIRVRADNLMKLWLNGKPVGERAKPEAPGEGPLRLKLNLAAGSNELLIKVVNHQGACFFSFDREVIGIEVPPPELAAALASSAPLSADQENALRRFFNRKQSPDYRTLDDQVEKWREEEAALDTAIPRTLVAREMAKPRETVILMRGEYDKPGEKVAAGVPAILPPWPAQQPTNRLGFARWLLSPEHPLTSRVTVNRLWQQFFGVGLVKTADDFGVQGEQPSHPELLDWLATDFMRSGWDVKRMVRMIVTSAAYRQDSAVSPELLAKDPENRLLARGPRYRLDGESVRDLALYVGGLLVEQRGGRSVKPYEPPGLWEAVSFNNSQKYVPETGEAQYRRSLYTFWKRQSPPPNMLIFDAPTREFCVVRRPRTNTPLQALVTLNDPHFVEASRALAYRLLTEVNGDATKRARYAFRIVTGRICDAAEAALLVKVYQEQLEAFRANPDAARQLLQVGVFKPAKVVDSAELAAWSTVASVILNLDETVTKG